MEGVPNYNPIEQIRESVSTPESSITIEKITKALEGITDESVTLGFHESDKKGVREARFNVFGEKKGDGKQFRFIRKGCSAGGARIVAVHTVIYASVYEGGKIISSYKAALYDKKIDKWKYQTPETASKQYEKEVKKGMYVPRQEHPEIYIPTEFRRDAKEGIAKFEVAVVLFEAEYPLADLHAITEISREEVSNHPLRQPAKIALDELSLVLRKIEEETDITSDEDLRLNHLYKTLSRAVGNFNNGKIRHD